MDVTLPQLMMVIIPSTFLAVIIGSISVFKKGKELADDPIYLKRLEEGKIKSLDDLKSLNKKELKNAKGSTFMFFLAIIIIVIIGIFLAGEGCDRFHATDMWKWDLPRFK